MARARFPRRAVLSLELLEDRYCLSGSYCAPGGMVEQPGGSHDIECHGSREKHDSRHNHDHDYDDYDDGRPPQQSPNQGQPAGPSFEQTLALPEGPKPRPEVISEVAARPISLSLSNDPLPIEAASEANSPATPTTPTRMSVDMASAETEEVAERASEAGQEPAEVAERNQDAPVEFLTSAPAAHRTADASLASTGPNQSEGTETGPMFAQSDPGKSEITPDTGSLGDMPRLMPAEPNESDLVPLDLSALAPVFADLQTDITFENLPSVQQALQGFFQAMGQLDEPTEESTELTAWHYAAPTVLVGAGAGYLLVRRRQRSPASAEAVPMTPNGWPKDEPLL